MSKSYFDRIAGDVHAAAPNVQYVYDEIARYANPIVKGKKELDVGNGGLFGYYPSLAHSIIAMDVSAGMLEKITGPNITKVLADARSMSGVPGFIRRRRDVSICSASCCR
jgi:hypothetical protein